MANVTVTTTFTFEQAVLQDLMTHWLNRYTLMPLVLAGPIGVNDTTVTLTGTPNIQAGAALVIDPGQPASEPMMVTGINGAVITVARGAAAYQLAVAQAHDTSARIGVLAYPNFYEPMVVEAIMPWAQQISKDLGNKSAVYAYSVSGSIVSA